jgi:hypothetical protein
MIARLTGHGPLNGLDFGCGPQPVLSGLFEAAGHRMALYDKFYYPDSQGLAKTYDFITSTEVFEHLATPGDTLTRIWNCLRPGGLLGIMTRLIPEDSPFAKWWYHTDATHICFYARPTFEWMAKHLKSEVTILGEDVILMSKPC